MKAIIAILCIPCLLSACQHVAPTSPATQTEIVKGATLPGGDTVKELELPPDGDITALLDYRARRCAQPATDRRKWLADHRSPTDHDQRLRLLITASCDPAKNAGVLSEMAARLRGDYAADDSFREFLTLVETFSSALNAQQKHLERTIRGLTDIEEDIGKQSSTPPKPQGN